jgi:hypothetical protein
MAGDPPKGRRVMLWGRRQQCEALDGLLAEVRAGRSRVLVVRGEAGIGKTALLGYAAETAQDFQVARAEGAESEMELPFAALHQLCAPMLGRLDRLPGPQRDALGVAFGLSSGRAPDRFLVGLAVLGLLSEAAADRPLLCLVDDAQWLDQASAQALAFVARRLDAESVALLFGTRDPAGEGDLAGLPGLALAGLWDADARALLASVLPGRLDERVRDRIIAESGGNPLALLELPRGVTAAELAGGFGLPGAGPLSGRLEDIFRSPSMTRKCIWMGVFSHVVTLPLLTAHSSASRMPGLRFWIQRQMANVSVALPPRCLPVSDCCWLPAIVMPGGARSYPPRGQCPWPVLA